MGCGNRIDTFRPRRRVVTALTALLLFGAGIAGAADRRVIAEAFTSPT